MLFLHKPSVLVTGYTQLNLGDDLFFHILFERHPDVPFVFIAGKGYKRLFRKYPNVTVFDRLGWLHRKTNKRCIRRGMSFNLFSNELLTRAFRRLYNIRALLHVGGSIFMEKGCDGETLHAAYMNALRCFPEGTPFYVLGCNFGPWQTEGYRLAIRRIVGAMRDVCFRDKVSYDLFADLPQARLANDIAFHKRVDTIPAKERMVCFSLTDLDKFGTHPLQEAYDAKIRELLLHYHAQGYRVVMMSFCRHEGDEATNQRVMAPLGRLQGVEHYCYDGDMDAALSLLGRCERMVATRFHAVVLAFIYGVQVLPVAYNNKTRDMLSTYNLWRDSYSPEGFCHAPIESLQQAFIGHVEIDESRNIQFDVLDKDLQNMKP